MPGSLETRTGGYEYDRRIIRGLVEQGWHVDVHSLADGFPFPTLAALEDAARALRGLPDDALVLVDGLAFGAMPDVVRREATRLRFVALVHHPLADETGLDPETADVLAAGERAALAVACAVVVTSRRTAVRLGDFGVTGDRITVVEPGTDPAPLARGSGGGEVAMLCVATLTPRKGHDVLLAALSELGQLHWRLTCVGSLDRDAAHVSRLRAQIEQVGLGQRVELVGEAGEGALAPFYDRSDLFVLPTYYEGYGMVVAEALAHGLPVVSTPTGAIPELVGEDAGALVPPGDVPALRDALGRTLGDPDVRAAMAAGARRVRSQLPTWEQASAVMAALLVGLESRGRV